MIRRLDDTRVGEYKSNWYLMAIYSLLIIGLVVAIFLLPTYSFLDADKVTSVSPVDYFRDKIDGGNFKYIEYCYIGYCIFTFLNLIICLSINKIGRSSYSKISKVIEIMVGFVCLLVHSLYIIKCVRDNTLLKDNVIWFILWMYIVLVISFLELIIYYKTKKVSIYD